MLWNAICHHYYTTQAVRGPITKINQSKCSVTGPIYSKYWTGHCPKWFRSCVFAVFAFLSRVTFFSRVTLLTKLAWDRTGRISALGLFLYGPRGARSVLSRPRADILPLRACSIRYIWLQGYRQVNNKARSQRIIDRELTKAENWKLDEISLFTGSME